MDNRYGEEETAPNDKYGRKSISLSPALDTNLIIGVISNE